MTGGGGVEERAEVGGIRAWPSLATSPGCEAQEKYANYQTNDVLADRGSECPLLITPSPF